MHSALSSAGRQGVELRSLILQAEAPAEMGLEACLEPEMGAVEG